jgi:hypothetical protein
MGSRSSERPPGGIRHAWPVCENAQLAGSETYRAEARAYETQWPAIRATVG